MKNNLIYFAFLLLACIAGINNLSLAQCSLATASTTQCGTVAFTVTVTPTPSGSETWGSSDASVLQ